LALRHAPARDRLCDSRGIVAGRNRGVARAGLTLPGIARTLLAPVSRASITQVSDRSPTPVPGRRHCHRRREFVRGRESYEGGQAVKVDWRRERDLVLVALMFFTRIPLPRWVPFDAARLNGAARYFPLVGLLVGAVAALVYGVAVNLWSPALALVLATAASVLLTGAFHEDGFADVCDGFGGGWDREQILTIMKDSRIGTYGTVGLGLLFAGKFFALEALDNAGLVVPALLAGHAWSRLLATSYLVDHEYVREDTQSRAKPLATKLTLQQLGVAALLVAPLVLLVSLWQLLWIAVALLIWRWWFGRYIKRRIGGYTGDCLGAAQQVAEVVNYLVLAAL
jgi:adenosylcobinamide-GDP ribazoletransferase